MFAKREMAQNSYIARRLVFDNILVVHSSCKLPDFVVQWLTCHQMFDIFRLQKSSCPQSSKLRRTTVNTVSIDSVIIMYYLTSILEATFVFQRVILNSITIVSVTVNRTL